MDSWIEGFVAATDNLDSPRIFRQWAAIGTLAATLEQKVWLTTSSPIFPNVYCIIVGHPGTGKTRTIRAAKKIVTKLPDFFLAPISMTWASLVDTLEKSRRSVVRIPEGQIEYNSMFICADEIGNFIHKYEGEIMDGLSGLYDADEYSQKRRTGGSDGQGIKIKIESPQLNILCGATPQTLAALIPERAWGQGFMSRVMLVFSDERIVGDDFAATPPIESTFLEHDLAIINGVYGQFEVTADYRTAVNNWREMGEPPVPNHPRLIHYITRRRVHLYKLSMISAIDRSNALILTREDFNRALGWIVEAEVYMPDIFSAGAANADGQAMDDIQHFITITDPSPGKAGVSEQRIIHFAKDRVPFHSILRIIEIMQRSGMIRCVRTDRTTRLRYFSVSGAGMVGTAGSPADQLLS